MKFSFIYITASTFEEARRISDELLSSRLVACTNILPGVTSTYWWEGKVQTSQEVALILKTRSANVSKIIDHVKSVHSYECPCVVALPIQKGHPEFLNWIKSSTEPVG